jgi:cytochrome c551/c552
MKFAAAGADVAVNYASNEQAAAKLAEEIRAAHPGVKVVVLQAVRHVAEKPHPGKRVC